MNLSKENPKIYKKYRLVRLIDQFIWRILNHNVQAYSAQIAYFTLLSIFPFLVVLLNIITRFSVVHPDSISSIIALFPRESREIIQLVLSDLKIGFGSDIQLFISILGGLYSSSLGVKPIIAICNQSFGFEHAKSGIKLMITGMIFTLSFILMIMILFITGILGDKIFHFISDFLHLPPFFTWIWYLMEHTIAPIYMVLTIFLINRYSLRRENRKLIPMLYALPGAILSTVLMISLSSAFNLSLSISNKYALTYGSISGVIILIIWLFLIGVSLISGFELNGALYDLKNKQISELKKSSIINKFFKIY